MSRYASLSQLSNTRTNAIPILSHMRFKVIQMKLHAICYLRKQLVCYWEHFSQDLLWLKWSHQTIASNLLSHHHRIFSVWPWRYHRCELEVIEFRCLFHRTIRMRNGQLRLAQSCDVSRYWMIALRLRSIRVHSQLISRIVGSCFR